jgi:hypothetical protein
MYNKKREKIVFVSFYIMRQGLVEYANIYGIIMQSEIRRHHGPCSVLYYVYSVVLCCA